MYVDLFGLVVCTIAIRSVCVYLVILGNQARQGCCKRYKEANWNEEAQSSASSSNGELVNFTSLLVCSTFFACWHCC